ncbi:MAG: tripartite tricarboxylate transporter substrate-binding protein [Deltaproteobacteria bacterium]|nr:tripartite tricarboxylate transporter substrate-binding protein [Deltaproteobacteria bacterium]
MIKKYTRIRIGSIATTALLTAMLAVIPAVFAADGYPSKPIRLLVPYGPTGVGGQTARIVADKLSSTIGQKVEVENLATAGIPAVAERTLKAPADGYTIFHGGIGVAINASMVKGLSYNVLKDFTQLSTLASYDLVVCANPESPLNSLAQFLEAAKASPGKLKLGTVTVGSTQHLSAELFKSLTGIDITVVPHKGTPDLLTALRSGAVDVAFELVPGIMPEIKSKAIKILANAASKRYVGLPDTPTATELGMPSFQVTGWNAYSVKAGTPQPIIDRLNKEIATALKSPDVIQQMRAIGAEPWATSSEEAGQVMTREMVRWKKVIDRANLSK